MTCQGMKREMISNGWNRIAYEFHVALREVADERGKVDAGRVNKKPPMSWENRRTKKIHVSKNEFECKS